MCFACSAVCCNFEFFRKMKLELDREKGLELFGKLIRTKNVESLQGDQTKTGPEPLHPADSKQKLQVNTIFAHTVMANSQTLIFAFFFSKNRRLHLLAPSFKFSFAELLAEKVLFPRFL